MVTTKRLQYYAAPIVKEYDFRAICYSEECFPDPVKKKYPNSYKSGWVTTAGQVKDVSKHTDWCPDCQHALFWLKGPKYNSLARK